MTDVLFPAMTWRPVLPVLQIGAITLVLAALAIWAYARVLRSQPARATGLLLMRLVGLAALATLLLGPSRLPAETTRPGRPDLLVLLDLSASMLSEDADETTRIAYLKRTWLRPEQWKKLAADFNLRLVGFDETSRALNFEALRTADEQLATGRVSLYAESITDQLLNLPTTAADTMLLVLGDGHDSEDQPLQAAAALARARQVRVHTVSVGSAAAPADLALVALPRQPYLMVDEPGEVTVKLYRAGTASNRAVVHLRQGEKDEKHEVNFEDRDSVTLSLPVVQDKPGVYAYQVEVEPLPGEVVTDNNRQKIFVEVTERGLRVLLLEGEPFWDTKFLAQSLRSDARIELTQVSQLAPDKRQDVVTRVSPAGAILPRTLEHLATYELIILGRGIENILPPETLAHLADYVRTAGGNLVLARGRPYDPDTPAGRAARPALEPVEPVTWAQGAVRRLPLKLTLAGRASPTFAFDMTAGSIDQVVADLPPLDHLHLVERVKPATIVLARAGRGNDAPPAVVSMVYGRGRVFAILGEGLWRWSFLSPGSRKYAGIFDTFWSNTVRHLALGSDFEPGQQIALNLSRSTLRLGDPIRIEATLKTTPPPAFAPTLKVTGPDGTSRQLSLQAVEGRDRRLQATFTPDHTGVFEVVLDAPPLAPAHQQRQFSVYDLDLERLRPAARPHVLRELADRTGGLSFRADQAPDLAEQLRRQRLAEKVPPRPAYIWDRGLVLALLLIWMGLEWIGRRQSGWL